jgi:hypothetical protein
MPSPFPCRCGRIRPLITVTCGLAAACFALVAFAETIRLGGPRDIVVAIDDVRDGFSVTVEMLPVTCFDGATNARINRSKAYLYGLAGLAKSLDIDAARLSAFSDVSGVTVKGVQPGVQRYSLVFFVPEAGLDGLENGESGPVSVDGAGASVPAPQASSQLFTCVYDYEMTIGEVQKGYADQVSKVVHGVANGASDDSVEKRAQIAHAALAAIDADARKAFEAAKNAFEEDLRVLSVEKEVLLLKLTKAQGDFEAAKTEALVQMERLVRLAAENSATAEGPTNSNQRQVPK